MLLSKLRSALWAAPMIVLTTAIMGTLSLGAAFLDRTGRVSHSIARTWGWLLCRIAGVRLTVEGLEHVSPQGRYVFAANHRSLMDIPALLPTLPVQFRFFATRGLFKIPFIGTHLQTAGHIKVDRHNAREAVRSLTQGAKTITDLGYSVLVFPEGGRTEGEIRPLKDGAAYVAIKAGAPIIPIYMRGMRNVLPMGSLMVKPARVRMIIGEPIPTAGLKLSDRLEVTHRLQAIFEQCEARPL